MNILLVALLIGATVRLTRLVTADEILERPRAWIEHRLPDKLQYFLRCSWCTSWWVGLAVFTLGWYGPAAVAWIVAGALTASLFAAWAAEVEHLFDIIVDLLAPDDDVDEPDEPVVTGRTYDTSFDRGYVDEAWMDVVAPRFPDRQ